MNNKIIAENSFNFEIIIQLIFSLVAFIFSVLIAILFIFWIFKVLKSPPKIGNSWIFLNSNRRFFNGKNFFSLDKILKAIKKEREHKKNYYKKNKIFK